MALALGHSVVLSKSFSGTENLSCLDMRVTVKNNKHYMNTCTNLTTVKELQTDDSDESFLYDNQNRLSIGAKINDGILPDRVMGTAEDLMKAKNQCDLILKDENELKDSVYDLLRTIKDPEKPQTLEELDVVYEDCINICKPTPRGICVIRVEFNPTVPHCSLATLIGLCIRVKLERNLMAMFKLDIYIKEGAHATEHEINKQINDKERIAAAMENPNLRELVEKCIREEE